MPELPNVVIWSIPAVVLLTLFDAVSFRLHAAADGDRGHLGRLRRPVPVPAIRVATRPIG